MARLAWLSGCVCVVGSCSGPADKSPAATRTGPRLYVTNERSGSLTIVDVATRNVVATVPLGKRPRGLKPSLDGRRLFVALSGSPIAGPGVDESKLPPPDRQADGIGVVDVQTNTLVTTLPGGSDPEQVDVSKDGLSLFRSEEHTSE